MVSPKPKSRSAARKGLGNKVPPPTGRTYVQIFRENIFTFINMVIFLLGVALVLVGRPSDALVSLGVISANVLVSVVQEIRAKRTLDRIAVLTRPTAQVVRDGRAAQRAAGRAGGGRCAASQRRAIRSCSTAASSATGRCRWTNRS